MNDRKSNSFLNNFLVDSKFKISSLDKLFKKEIKSTKPCYEQRVYFDNIQPKLSFNKIIYATIKSPKSLDQIGKNKKYNFYSKLPYQNLESLSLGKSKINNLSKILKDSNNQISDLQPKFLINYKKQILKTNEKNSKITIYLSPTIKILSNNKWEVMRQVKNKILLSLEGGICNYKSRLQLLREGEYFIPPLYYICVNEEMVHKAKKSKNKPTMEIEEKEIESKLSCKDDFAYKKIYDYMLNTNVNNFGIEKNYPHLLSRGLLVCYIKKENSPPLKLVFSGFHSPVSIQKSSISSYEEPSKFYILERKEQKNVVPVDKELLLKTLEKDSNWLHKRKFAFWIQNKETKRIYHIAHDKCQNLKGKMLSQVEVEYAGIISDENNVKKRQQKKNIIKDIAKITDKLQNKFPFLSVSKKEKEEWAKE